MKESIILDSAVRLKVELENSLDKDNEKIEALSDEADVEKLEEIQVKKIDLIMRLHTAIQEANLQRGRGEKFCNAEYVKLLSEKKRKAQSIPRRKCYSNQEETTKALKAIQTEQETIRAKLSKFNLNHKVKIDLDEKELRDWGITTSLNK